MLALRLVEAETSARPVLPSAIRLEEAKAKPAGRVAAGAGADEDEAAADTLALADDGAGMPPIGVRSALSLVVSYESESAL